MHAITPSKRIEFRIDINLGGVIVDGRDLYGDGINVAARLEALAGAGGICISQIVFNHIRDKIPFAVEDAGEHTLKNIARPVRIYRVRLESPSTPGEPPAVMDRPSIAVLPFSHIEFFADGVVEDITTLLYLLPGFFVIARNSSFTYKGRSVDTRQVARDLGVRYLIEGCVQKAGQRVRVTAQRSATI